MTARPVSIEELTTAREELIALVVGQAPEAHRRFFIDLKSAIWPLDVADLAQIPFFIGHDGNGRYEFVRVFLGFARLKRQSNSNADGNGFG